MGDLVVVTTTIAPSASRLRTSFISMVTSLPCMFIVWVPAVTSVAPSQVDFVLDVPRAVWFSLSLPSSL